MLSEIREGILESSFIGRPAIRKLHIASL